MAARAISLFLCGDVMTDGCESGAGHRTLWLRDAGQLTPAGRRAHAGLKHRDAEISGTATVIDTVVAAREYVERGWSVIPLQHADKRPLIRWQEFQYRRAEPPEVESWLQRWPDANLGVVTGLVSGLIVVDIDPAHGGEESLAALQAAKGTLPVTQSVRTGGGGRHLYFRHPGGVIRNRAGLRPGIDLRGDGGYVVAPPSLHPNGRRYAWIPDRGSHEAALASLPVWLLTSEAHQSPLIGRPPAYWRELLRTGVPEGERNNSIASLTGHLLWHGVDPEVACELMICWNRVRCRPPLGDDEAIRTVNSIARLHVDR